MSAKLSLELQTAGAECIQEMSSALLKSAGEVMKRHGADPNGPALVAAGFAMALRVIGTNIDPKVPIIVHEMLKPRVPT